MVQGVMLQQNPGVMSPIHGSLNTRLVDILKMLHAFIDSSSWTLILRYIMANWKTTCLMFQNDTAIQYSCI